MHDAMAEHGAIEGTNHAKIVGNNGECEEEAGRAAVLFADLDPMREGEQQVHGDHAVEAELAVFDVDGRVRERFVVARARVVETGRIASKRHSAPFRTEAEKLKLARIEVPTEAERGSDTDAAFEFEGRCARAIGNGLSVVVFSAGLAFLHANECSSCEEADVGVCGESAEQGEFAAERHHVDLGRRDELDLAELIIDEVARGLSTRRLRDAWAGQVDGGKFARRNVVRRWRCATPVCNGLLLKLVGERRGGRDAVGTPHAETNPVGRMPTDAQTWKDRALVFI